MKHSEVLTRAKALIDTPEKWTREFLARNADGLDTSYSSPGAVCFCSLGAVYRAASELTPEQLGCSAEKASHMYGARWLLEGDLHEQLARNIPKVWPRHYDVPDFNDSPRTTHADVMAMFDRAIEAAKAQEAAS